MEEMTLGQLATRLGRYKAQVVPLVALLLIAVFLDGKPTPSDEAEGRPAAQAGASSAPVGSVQVATPLVESTGGAVYDVALPDLRAAGAVEPGGSKSAAETASEPTPDLPPVVAPFSCDNDASLPMPVLAPAMEQLRAAQAQVEAAVGELPENVTAYIAGAAGCSPGVDPLTLVVAQLGPLLTAAGPALDVMREVNSMLPPLPAFPSVAFPELPAGLGPVLGAASPATSEVCGQIAIAVILSAVLANFPTPITGQHINAALNPVFGACSALNPRT